MLWCIFWKERCSSELMKIWSIWGLQPAIIIIGVYFGFHRLYPRWVDPQKDSSIPCCFSPTFVFTTPLILKIGICPVLKISHCLGSKCRLILKADGICSVLKISQVQNLPKLFFRDGNNIVCIQYKLVLLKWSNGLLCSMLFCLFYFKVHSWNLCHIIHGQPT